MEKAKDADEFDAVFKRISGWINALRSFPGFHEWKLASIASTLSTGEPWRKAVAQHPEAFHFPPHIEKQHAAITAFLALHSTYQAMADAEFYFRRYPFTNLPISLDAHLRYTCENYFGRVYEFSERMKKVFAALNEIAPKKLAGGPLIKMFKNEFDQEIRARNLINHHYRFEEETIDRIMLEGMLALSDEGEGLNRGWKGEQRATYRKASKEWAERAKRRSARVRDYLNAIASLVNETCQFLSDPIIPLPNQTSGSIPIVN